MSKENPQNREETYSVEDLEVCVMFGVDFWIEELFEVVLDGPTLENLIP